MFEVFGFYKFIKVKSLKKNEVLLQDFLIKNKIRGTIIIANEGLNGTISGKSKNIKVIINKLKKIFSFKEFDNSNKSISNFQPFTLASPPRPSWPCCRTQCLRTWSSRLPQANNLP